MERFKDWSIGKKLGMWQFGVILISFIAMTVFITSFMTLSMEAKAKNELRTQETLATGMIDAYRSVLEEKADIILNVFASYFTGRFTLVDGDPININGVQAPILKHNGLVVDLNYSEVDRLTRLTGATATVFARKDNDFIRVTTSLKKEDGSRAIGTLLEHSHPAYEGLLKGESFVGKAGLFGRDYMTKYVPIKDDSGKSIGVLYIGYDFTEGLKSLKDKINSVKIGETGFIYILNAAEGKEKGALVIHPTDQGRVLLGVADAKGIKFADEMIDSKQGEISYYWSKEDGQVKPHKKFGVYSYYKPWNWVVVANSKAEEISRTAKQLRNYIILISIAVAALIVFLLQILTTQWILNPINRIMTLARDIADGKEKLTKRLQVGSKDEIGILASSFNAMIESLVALILRMREAVASITSSSQELLAAFQEQAAGTREQSAAVAQTSSAARELSVSSEQVGESIRRVAAVANHALSGVAKIKESISKMGLMISSLGDKSQKIGKITELIDDVADQTNLLAVNAAIEAARAGEQGRGFTVVADEIRKLADSTAKSTKDITGLIETIQHEMSNAILFMETSVSSVDEEARLAQETSEKAKEIAMTANQQVSGAKQIAEAMINIDVVMKEISTGIQQSQVAVKELNDLAHDLTQIVSNFKVG